MESRLNLGSDHHTKDDDVDHTVCGQSVGRIRDSDECIDICSDNCIGLSDVAGLYDDTWNSYSMTNRMSPEATNPNEASGETDREQVDRDQEFSFFECSIRKLAEYDISVPSRRQKRCSHHNSAILSDGTMAFIDDNNICLKVVGKDFRILDFADLDTVPNDLAVTGDDMIAVAVERSVCLFRVDTVDAEIRLRKGKSFLTRDIVYSLCVVVENIGVLYSDEEDETDETYIEIRNRNGKIMQTIDTFWNRGGCEIDLYAPYTIRCRYSDELIVCEADRLKAFRLTGDLRWFYKHNGSNIDSIAFDDKKNIYICDSTDKAICQMSASSYRNHRVLIANTGIKKPRSVLVNSKDRTLVVGFGNSNLVQVYKFV